MDPRLILQADQLLEAQMLMSPKRHLNPEMMTMLQHKNQRAKRRINSRQEIHILDFSITQMEARLISIATQLSEVLMLMLLNNIQETKTMTW